MPKSYKLLLPLIVDERLLDAEEIEIFDVFDIRKKVVRMKHFCADCGKENSDRTERCFQCAQKFKWVHPTKAMINQLEYIHALPRSLKQIESSRKAGRMIGNLPKTDKQREWSRKHFSRIG